MSFQWLWLEDEETTVADLLEIASRRVPLTRFARITDLTRWLLQHRAKIQSSEVTVGFVLDVMIRGAHAITRPAGWLDDAGERSFLTESGYEAGLVFYENLILPELSEKEKSWFPEPPPVIFLTVLHTDHEGMGSRLEALKKRWQRLHPQKRDTPMVRWIRKWDTTGEQLVSILREWGRGKTG